MLLWIYLLVINVLTFFIFRMDKKAAVHNRWRTPEATLLGLCLIGGAAGGFIAMHVFHHKTKKPLFAAGVPVVIAVHILLILAYMKLILK